MQTETNAKPPLSERVTTEKTRQSSQTWLRTTKSSNGAGTL